MCSSFVSAGSKASPCKYGGRVCSQRRRRLGGVQCGSAILCARGGDRHCDWSLISLQLLPTFTHMLLSHQYLMLITFMK